jgi:hypothetical protein
MQTQVQNAGTGPCASIAGWTTFRHRFAAEVAAAGLSLGASKPDCVEEREIAGLPDTVQRYLRFMRVVGRPREWSFRSGWSGSFRLGPDKRFIPCEAWQYNNAIDVARIFHIRMKLGGVLPVVARDTFLGGEGRMFVKLFDALPVIDATGSEFDISELVTSLRPCCSRR